MGMIHPVEIAGLVLETVSEVASEGSSWMRTRRYLKKMNGTFFEPRGLSVRICGFEQMLDSIGVSKMWVRGCLEMREKWGEEVNVTLEFLETLLENCSETDVERVHPRLRLLQALEGYVALLERVSMPVDTQQQTNILGRIHASYAAREEQKRTEELDKKQDEAKKRQAEKYKEAIEVVQRRNKEIAKVQEKIRKAEAKCGEDKKEAAKKIDRLTAELSKVEKEKQRKVRERLQSADKALEKLEQKEMEEMMKIKWLVISRLETIMVHEAGI
jgi:DNA repair exonuclease SbcCD ATPase subunit